MTVLLAKAERLQMGIALLQVQLEGAMSHMPPSTA